MIAPWRCHVWRAANLQKAGCVFCCAARDANGMRGAPVGGMSKQKGRVPKLSKLTGTDGTAVVDFETGILIGVSNDSLPQRSSQEGALAADYRLQPPRNPNSKPSRN